jgi:hypothetical protein
VKREVLILGPSLPELVDISVQLGPASYTTIVAETRAPFEYMSPPGGQAPDGVIMKLNGRENVAEFRSLLNRYPRTSFVFLAAEFPPHAAIARVVSQHSAAILRASESPLAIVATLIALIYQKQGASA